MQSTTDHLSKPKFYAHTLEGRPITDWEPLEKHLAEVSHYAKDFASEFNAQEWAALAGLWHDLGKYSEAFQRYLRQENGLLGPHELEIQGKVDHATAGAQWAVEKFSERGKLLAYAIAGHHGGLPDWFDGLNERLKKTIEAYKMNTPKALLEKPLPPMPKLGQPENNAASFRVAFWIRMLFSTLVDADFLATEGFMNPGLAAYRPQTPPSLKLLDTTLDQYLTELAQKAPPSNVMQHRQNILSACQNAAEQTPGFFSLCVPTGGGKTLSSLSFALKHAQKYNKKRIIIAIPFTSIIEQNAQVYRNVFKSLGQDIVLEHHCNLDPAQESTQSRLQTENWDAPLIVTTNVQLFESLFSNKPSQCRKLHRIANSIIILDEAQTIPVAFLQPTLWALNELVSLYGCTIVLCSATQPAVEWRDNFKIGLKNIRPIISDTISLHRALQRTQVQDLGLLNDDTLAQHLLNQPQVLCILNTRPHAATVFSKIRQEEGTYHLSTRMCAMHRLSTLNIIRQRLKMGQPCRVVSTQLIEAGVDVDFPTVYRAPCGLDSLTQAAGRCNREGQRSELGQVYLFDCEKLPPPGHLRQTADTAKEFLRTPCDLLAPDTIEAFFQLHYWRQKDQWDKHQVLQEVNGNHNQMQFGFKSMAAKYRLIEDDGEKLLIPWQSPDPEEARQIQSLFYDLKKDIPLDRVAWRRLQRLSISVRPQERAKLEALGAIQRNTQGFWMLIREHFYDVSLGLLTDAAPNPYDNIL